MVPTGGVGVLFVVATAADDAAGVSGSVGVVLGWGCWSVGVSVCRLESLFAGDAGVVVEVAVAAAAVTAAAVLL